MSRGASSKSWQALLALSEDVDLECKDARGGLPGSLWETYSAMANTDGGVILLGIDRNGRAIGVPDAAALRKAFWDTINNKGKVSSNLLADSDVREVDSNGCTLLEIRVPRAERRQRPVYVGQNPLTGTYRRNFEGDYHCTERDVARMLADRADEPPDSRIVPGFDVEDLDAASVQQYRQRFSARTPSHAWLSEEPLSFLGKLGAWRRDQRTGEEGLTVAGLLMFGRMDTVRSIEAVPEYHVDYRELPAEESHVRWTDRLTIDGTWEANLFQFYQRVIGRLAADLKLPFQLEPGLFSRGETIVHEAIREALANALIHADYRGEGGIVIEKYRDRFEISNPGTLLISFEQLLRGGISECRNKSLQTMFFMIGAAEKAGSGYDKIRRGWRSQHWRHPSIQERVQPSRVHLIMPMVSLMPEEALAALRQFFGAKVNRLSPSEVQALVTAYLEGQVSNSRMREICDEHPADLTRMFRGLVQRGFLWQTGQKRGTTYELAAPHVRSMDGSTPVESNSAHTDGDFAHNAGSAHKGQAEVPRSLSDLPPEELDQLRKRAGPALLTQRMSPDRTRQIILELCYDRFLTAALLGQLMGRNPAGLSGRFLRPMVQEGLLRLRYPDKPNRPDQAYTSAPRAPGEETGGYD